MKEGRRLIQAVTGLALTIVLTLPTFYSATAISIFTGDAPADFADSNAIVLVDNSTDSDAETGEPDVSMPSAYDEDDISGWDINALYMEYDPVLDMLFVGIDCFGVCGDADGDGNANRAGRTMRSDDGTDVANLGAFESIALLIDTDNDYRSLLTGDFDIAVGVSQNDSLDNLGVYQFTGATRSPQIGFGRRLANVVTKYSIPNPSTPDLEFGIADFSQLPGFDFEPGKSLSFNVMLYAGSQRDGDIGEDYLPSRGKAAQVTIEKTSTRASSASTSSTGTSSSSASNTVAQATAVPTQAPTRAPTLQPTPTYTPPPTATPVPVSSSPPGRLQLPSIGVDTVVEPMGWSRVQQDDGTFATDWDVVDFAAGWHKNSSLPNKTGNVVLSGHNTIGGSVFRDLYELKDGDEIVLWQDNQPIEYTIDQVVILPEQYATHEQRVENASFMENFGDERITLISCWPPGSASHRVVVVGKRDK